MIIINHADLAKDMKALSNTASFYCRAMGWVSYHPINKAATYYFPTQEELNDFIRKEQFREDFEDKLK